jgi:hypothetical protein
MKKAYVIFPVVALLIFFGFWWNFHSTHQAVLAEKAKQVRLAKEAKDRKAAEDRITAIKDALLAQEKRKKEREAKEIKEKADREARELAIDNRNKADQDVRKLSKQKDGLINDVKSEKEALAKLDEQKRKALDEQAFLKEYVRKADVNAKGLNDVLDKIAAADAARAAAEAAAAAAAKKNNS